MRTAYEKLGIRRDGHGRWMLNRVAEVNHLAVYWNDSDETGRWNIDVDGLDAEREMFREMIPTDVPTSEGQRWGGIKHNFVLAPISLDALLQTPAADPTDTSGKQADPKEGRTHFNVHATIKHDMRLSLNGGQYCALVNLSYYFMKHSRQARYHDGSAQTGGALPVKFQNQVFEIKFQRPEVHPVPRTVALMRPGCRQTFGSVALAGARMLGETASPRRMALRRRSSSTGAHGLERAPGRADRPQPNIKEWWQYAGACVLYDIKTLSQGHAVDRAITRRANNRRYVDLVKHTRGHPWRPNLPLPASAADREWWQLAVAHWEQVCEQHTHGCAHGGLRSATPSFQDSMRHRSSSSSTFAGDDYYDDLTHLRWLPIATDSPHEWCKCAACKAEEKAEVAKAEAAAAAMRERRQGVHPGAREVGADAVGPADKPCGSWLVQLGATSWPRMC